MAGMIRLSKATIFLGVLIACYIGSASAGVLFNTLKPTLEVTASPKPGSVVHAREDEITVTWKFNTSQPANAADSYKSVKVSLCYAPVSQVDRKWRKSNNDLKKDKACQFKIVKQPYTGSGNYTYLIKREVPSAFYYVRAYALDASDVQVGYGQTKDQGFFEIVGISGRTVGIEISAAVFSAFSIAALVYFYIAENKKRK